MDNVLKSQCVPVFHDVIHSQELEHAKLPNGKCSQGLLFMVGKHSQEQDHANLLNGKRSQVSIVSQELEHATLQNGKRSQVLVFRSCTFTRWETFPSLNVYLCSMMQSIHKN